MNTIRISLISDNRVDGAIFRDESDRVRLAVVDVFGDAYGVEIWPHAVYANQDGSWEEKAQLVLKERIPDVVLCDALLGDTIRDGPMLLRAMCCDQKFAGFIYVWSSANEPALRKVCKEYGLLFALSGSGWFNNQETRRFAKQLHADYTTYGGCFSVPSPGTRCHCALFDAEMLLNKMLLLKVPDENSWNLDRVAVKKEVLGFLDRLKVHDASGRDLSSDFSNVLAAANELENAAPGDAIRRTADLRDAILELVKRFTSLSQ